MLVRGIMHCSNCGTRDYQYIKLPGKKVFVFTGASWDIPKNSWIEE